MARARIKHKGQVTIPQEFRCELGMEEGTIIEITKEDDKLIIKRLPPIEPGEPVGEEEYKKIIAELDEGRRNWR